MKISRMAEEKMAPEWIFRNKQASQYIDKETVSTEEIKRLASLSCDISDDDMVVEKDRIESCAVSKKPYHYSSKWSNSVKSELKEYAIVCGMDMSKFKSIDPSDLVVEASSSGMIKTASTVEAEAPKLVVDAFKIDEKIAVSHEKTKWKAEGKDASRLAEKPTMSGIVPIRGGEDYFANSEFKVARGQNSISDPLAIEKLAESTVEDTGSRLKRENAEKEASKKTRHEEWQKEKIAAMEGKEILPGRKVFPTESMNAQPGIKGEVFDFGNVPDKTVGEQIKQANEDRKEKIRGKEKGRFEFVLHKNPTMGISEDFGEELKKHLGQID